MKTMLISYDILSPKGVINMSNHSLVNKILDYIENHLDEDLSLDKMAGALNYSKFYLARVFAENTKITIYKYIKQRRLTIAAQKLVETKVPIIEIAYEAQYNSQQAFTLAFSQLYHCTPQVYRKSKKFNSKQSSIVMKETALSASAACSWLNSRRVA